MQKPYIVGIAGGSASGKTYLLRKLQEELQDVPLTLISLDNYYFDLEHQEPDENGEINFDHPSALDLERFRNDLKRLMDGESVSIREYHFNNPEHAPKTITYTPQPLIIIEGIFAFYDPKVEDMMDLRVFVDAEEHRKLTRRIKRDYEERGYTMDNVLDQYHRFVVPMYRRFVEPMKYEADLILNNHDNFAHGIRVLTDHLLFALHRRGIALPKLEKA